MRKILISSYNLDVGGIETALINLLKAINKKYEITLVLEKKEGIFLKELPENIKLITYTPNANKIIIIRKIINFLKQLKFKLKYKNKFDYSISYATYSYSSAFVAQNTSKNSYLWVHNDYLSFYQNNKELYKNFFEKLKIEKFKKIIFVSQHDKNVFVNEFPSMEEKLIVCNNLIDYKKILNLAEENVTDFEAKPIPTFINLGRHIEHQKCLSRIIEATKKLNKDGLKFRVIFVGEGKDTEGLKQKAQGEENIYFLGAKKNPYPYLKNSDCLVMSSDYEGYPVVFIESMILGKPIITTDVSDSKKDIDGKFGKEVAKSADGIYEAMKEFIEKGYKINKFEPEEYNEKIIKIINNLFEI